MNWFEKLLYVSLGSFALSMVMLMGKGLTNVPCLSKFVPSIEFCLNRYIPMWGVWEYWFYPFILSCIIMIVIFGLITIFDINRVENLK